MWKVLRKFEDRGVKVLIDPSLQLGRVTGEWEQVKVERLISLLVTPYSYLLEWERMQTPLGPLDRLTTIRIFSDGGASSAVRMARERRIFELEEGPDGTEYIRREILLGFKEGTSMKDLKVLLGQINGSVIEVIDPPGLYRIKLAEGMSVQQALLIARKFEGVEGAEPNFALRRMRNVPAELPAAGPGLNLHLPPGSHAIAVFDSGLDPQYAEMPFIKGTFNAVDPDEPMSDPIGHGNLTAMVASGALTPEGASPGETGAPVYVVRTFDENGVTSSDTIMRAFEYAAESGAAIVSMSWGSEVDSSFLRLAMDHAAKSGILLIASAGNEPTGEQIYPAGYPSVRAIGALNPDGSQWEKSNFGEFVDEFNWGFAVFENQTYSGTSIAAPLTAYETAIRLMKQQKK